MADLELTMLFKAMTGDDELVFDIAKTALLSSLRQPGAIRYRQDIPKDCLDNPATGYGQDLYDRIFGED